MSILGNRVLRKEDPRFLRGEGRYVENLPLEGALDVTFVRSPLAHARITGVDASAAEALPNVQVLTGADVDVQPIGAAAVLRRRAAGMRRARSSRRTSSASSARSSRSCSARTEPTGADAAELVLVDYDPLPVVVDVHEAREGRGAPLPGGGNERLPARAGPPEHDETLFDGCDVVVSGTLVSQRMAPCPLEPRSAAAEVGADGRVTAWLSTQAPHQDRHGLAAMLGLEPEQVRVIAPDVGGGFGAKTLERRGDPRRLARAPPRPPGALDGDAQREHARAPARPWRSSSTFTIGGTRDGKVLAYRLDILAGRGAYPGSARSCRT